MGLILTGGVFAADLSAFQATCQDIGFKPKTPAFGECVLELMDRAGGSQAATTSTPTDAHSQTCVKYGFTNGTTAFSDCRMKLDMAAAESAQAQKKYEKEKAAYDEKVTYARSMRQIEAGLRMMGGQSPVEAWSSVGTGAPIRPSAINQTIIAPGGRIINCSTTGSITNCF
jgi:hypothetical protein